MIKIKRIVLLLLSVVCVLNIQAQNAAVIEKSHSRLVSYFRHNSMERICLITDKEVYKPGELILFNAVAGSPKVQGLHQPDTKLKVSLFDAEGHLVAEGNGAFSGGMAAGSLLIPGNIPEGKYVLEAHVDEAASDDEAFMKLVFIDAMNESDVVFHFPNAPEFLLAGQSHPLELQLSGLSGQAVAGRKLSYELMAGTDLLVSGKLKTDNQGIVNFNLEVPAAEYNESLLLKVGDSRELDYSRWFPVNTGRLKVTFYAEGGQFVAGIPMKAGFRVTTAEGLPVTVSAEITGEGGRVVSQAKTLIPGYGVFPMLVKAGEKCRFNITSELGKGQSFGMPPFEPEGFNFSVLRSDQGIIHLNLLFTESEAKQVNLLITRGDRLFWASTVEVRGTGRLRIPKTDLPDGLSLLSAFSEQGVLLGERLLYIEKGGELQLSVEAERMQAGAGQLLIKTVPPVKTDSVVITVSVSAAIKNIANNGDFVTCFRLNSLLENRISDISALRKEGILNENIINYLLICNRFRSYSWQSVSAFEAAGVETSVQKDWLSGYVLDSSDEPVRNAKVSLVHAGRAQMMNVTTDEDGHFVFSGVSPEKTGDHVLKAIAPDSKDKLTIKLDKDLHERLSVQVRRFLSAMTFIEKPQVPARFFAENPFLYTKAKRKAIPPQNRDASYLKYLRSGSSVMDVIKMIKPFQLADGDKIVFPGGANSLMAQDGALIVLDGQKLGTSASVLNSISPYDVESINISTSPVEISRYTGLNSVGLIEIMTRRGNSGEKEQGKPDTENAKEFKGGNNQTTLYWSPSLLLNSQGEVRVQLPATQVKGEFLVKVKAIDKDGRIGETVQTIKVMEE
ncbi:MAG: carboxypeptidase regulatory-like domain-containing protein [Prolixibacteraceae bacterium]